MNGFLEAQNRVLFEEFAEFTFAIHHEQGDAASELADVIVVAIGLLMTNGFTLEQLQDAIAKTAAKNDAKTLETHAKDAKGKVARKA
jgi:NTP pyrophosphatase (non-canonical NTP hydrolase)